MAKTRRVKFEFNETSLVSLRVLKEQGAIFMSIAEKPEKEGTEASQHQHDAAVRTLSDEQIIEAGWHKEDCFRKTINGVRCFLTTNRTGFECWLSWMLHKQMQFWPKPILTAKQLRSVESVLESF